MIFQSLYMELAINTIDGHSLSNKWAINTYQLAVHFLGDAIWMLEDRQQGEVFHLYKGVDIHVYIHMYIHIVKGHNKDGFQTYSKKFSFVLLLKILLLSLWSIKLI